MANTQQDTLTLKIDCLFVDGDTRIITLKEPRDDLETSDFTELNQFMQEKAIVIGDKYGGDFLRINSATRVLKSKITLDLSRD